MTITALTLPVCLAVIIPTVLTPVRTTVFAAVAILEAIVHPLFVHPLVRRHRRIARTLRQRELAERNNH